MAVAYQLLPFLVFVVSIFLAGLVLKSDFRSSRHRVFAAFLCATALWGLTIFGMRSSPTLQLAYQWEKWALTVIAFTGILFYHFTIRFTDSYRGQWILRAFYALGVVAGVLSLLGLAATGMQVKFYGYAPVLGPAFPVYLFVAYAPTFIGLSVLFRARRRSKSADERNRISYVLIGVALIVIGATTDFLPALGVPLYPLGIVGELCFGILATIAVTRYRLMDLRLVCSAVLLTHL